MKEKIKNLSNKKIVIISLCTFAIVLLLGLTYAIWSRTFSQTGENISTYDCFNITFNENVEGISMSNGYPISDEEGLKTDAYEVTITNTCKTAASYNVVLNKLNVSTLDDSHIKIAVNGDIKLLSETETTTTNIENANEGKIINTGVLVRGQERTISVQNWMDEATTKEEGTNKTFAYKITIETVAGKNKLLAANILSESIKEETPSFKIGEPPVNGNNTGSGLYKTEDDDGDSYYYRGKVYNNYVQIGNLKEAKESILWRVVRINGDGSIRLINDNIIGASAFNEYEGFKYVGYTYDNDTECTKVQPCTKDNGTSSTVKAYIEDWYDNSTDLKTNDNIVLGKYCSDTYSAKVNNSYIVFHSSKRINQGTPSLKCSDTNKTYGGLYKLKIGLLNAEELNMAGFNNYNTIDDVNFAASSDNYINSKNNLFWTLSPSDSDAETAFVFYGDAGIINSGGGVSSDDITVRPVINLKSDVKIASGDGTKNNPYIIE